MDGQGTGGRRRGSEEGGAGESDGCGPAPVRRSKRLAARTAPAVPEPVPPSVPPRCINLLELPTEMLLAVLEWLPKMDPLVLLGAVPGVCRRIRALCAGVRGEFDLRGEWARLDGRNKDGAGQRAGLKGALASATLHFPRTRGLWTFSEWPLHDACGAGLAVTARRLVEEDGGRVDEGDRWGCTPLFIACQYGHLEVARLLVEKGADMDKANDAGATPLFLACRKGHLEVVQLLVERGADTDKATNSGATPLTVARNYGHDDIVALLEQAGAAE